MDELRTFLEGVAVPLLLSLAGGTAKALRNGFGAWRQFLGSLVFSGFAGIIVHLLLQDLDLSTSLKSGLVGLSGYSGGALLDTLACRLQKSVARLQVGDGMARGRTTPAREGAGAPEWPEWGDKP